jgi:pimeloyl-[acyl-carrier protein] synthase
MIHPLPNIEDFDPSSGDFRNDPYPYYSALRKNSPCYYVEASGSWWFTRYSDVMRILSQPSFGREVPDEAGVSKEVTAVPKSLLYRDPPEHTRLRSQVADSFSFEVVQKLYPQMHRIAQDLLHPLESKQSIDFVQEFALPFPMIIIGEILGISGLGNQDVKKWSEAILLSVDDTQPPEVRKKAQEARAEFAGHIRELISERKVASDTLVSRLSFGERPDKLTEPELVSMLSLLMTAGYANTTNVLSAGLITLHENQEQLKLILRQRELMTLAVEELLRYVSPVHMTQRVSHDNFESHGKRVRKGDSVTVVIASANRDESIFAKPNVLDLARAPNPHLTFARGVHHCMGAALARAEISIGLYEFLSRFPHFVVEAFEWKPGVAIRGLHSLKITL